MTVYVTKNGIPVSPPLATEDAAWRWLLHHQPMSTDWAMEYEGYAIEPATPELFFARCAGHDWYYQMSDDLRVYQAGKAVRKALEREANESPVKQAIFDAWNDYYFSGPSFGTEQAPKPEWSTFETDTDTEMS